MKHLNPKVWAVLFVFGIAIASPGVVLYDNTTTQTGGVLMVTNNQEVGDEVLLGDLVGGSVADPYLTNFSLEYYSPNTAFSGSVQMDVRLYENNGALFNGYATPGTIFYDTGWFSIQSPNYYFPGTNSAVLDFGLSDLQGGLVPLNPFFQVPTNLTLSVTFEGLAVGDSVGLNIFNPATVGANYGDYWLNDSWQLMTNATTVAFGMHLDGQATPTPEPAVWALVAAGAALAAGFARRRQRGKSMS